MAVKVDVGDENVGNDWERLLNSGMKTDLTIYTKDEESTNCHFIVFFARCRPFLTEVVVENETSNILSWPDVSKDNLSAFLTFIYTGRLPKSKPTSSNQLRDFQILATKCHHGDVLSKWVDYVSTYSLSDFADTDEDVENVGGGFVDKGDVSTTATQNMNVFLDLMGKGDENGDNCDGDDVEADGKATSDGEWENVCDFLSQKQQQNVDNPETILEKIPIDVDARSPDLFDDDGDIFDQTKRNSGDIFDDEPAEKKARYDETDVTVYSRQCGSPISIDLSGDLDAEVNDEAEVASTSLSQRGDEVIVFDDAIESPSQNCPNDEVTPLKKSHSYPDVATPVTPMPDYESMLSPSLRHELRSFGLKVIPRRKAVPLLRHIYNETHPKTVTNGDNDLELSQDSIDGVAVPEESVIDKIDDVDCRDDLAKEVVGFIKSNMDIQRSCLLYMPLWLEDFIAKFKASTGIKCRMDAIKEILDNECLTFRTRAHQLTNNCRYQKRT